MVNACVLAGVPIFFEHLAELICANFRFHLVSIEFWVSAAKVRGFDFLNL